MIYIIQIVSLLHSSVSDCITQTPNGQVKVISDIKLFPNHDDAKEFIEANPRYRIVGADPFVSPVPLEELEDYELVYPTPLTRPSWLGVGGSRSLASDAAIVSHEGAFTCWCTLHISSECVTVQLHFPMRLSITKAPAPKGGRRSGSRIVTRIRNAPKRLASGSV